LFFFGLLMTLGMAHAHAQAPTPIPGVGISNLNDLSFGVYDGSGDKTLEDDVCIYSNPDPSYKVTATASTGDFGIQNGAMTIPFSVRFKSGNGAYQALTYNSPMSFSGADTTSTTCNGATNATYEVKFLRADLLKVPPGNYSGTLNLLVEPEVAP
jgi:hypothetical protein